jgi:hypothetical protein|tara:strand:- start:1488 stop:2039 length:552 start_codon:yes stop_codon:yes gene_type:complete
MTINIDLNLLKNTKLSADEFLALYCLYRKGYGYLYELNLNVDWSRLEQESYVKLGEKVEDHTVRQEFIDLFVNDVDSMFAQLVGTYPMKVNTNNGIRVLHAANPDAKSNDKARNKYRKLVQGKAHVHTRIMTLLDVQLTVERDNLAYMQNLETWINNHTWEKYENITENDTKDNDRPRITRSL